jgi:hypothetical protein
MVSSAKRLLAALCCVPLLVFRLEADDAQPSPPSRISQLGYLLVKEKASVTPPSSKVFLLPSATLLVEVDKDDGVILIRPDQKASSRCFMPRLRKYVVQLNMSDDGATGYLRAALELDALPFEFKPGEELPLAAVDVSTWIAVANCRGRDFNVSIPVGTPGFEFSKASRYDLFAEAQRAKGLALHRGEWIPKDKAEALGRYERELAAKDAAAFETLKKMARSGYLVLKNRSVLKGKYRGGDGKSVLFELPDGETRLIAPSDCADMDMASVLSMGSLSDARAALARASAKLKEGNFGHAAKYLDDAFKAFAKAAKDAQGREAVSKALADVQAALKKRLDAQDLEIYQWTPFKRADLKAHLDAGHVLLKAPSLWVKPSQICVYCDGEGELSCPRCGGLGKLKKSCPSCGGSGALACPICEGGGSKDCLFCKGIGYTTKICTRCLGMGYVGGYVYAPMRTSVIVSGNNSIVATYPGGCWPGYMQTVCSLCGGSGRERVICGYCDGTGRAHCPKTVKCKTCEGRGWIYETCPDCAGKGRVKCSHCGGRGYDGAPQMTPKADAKAAGAPKAPAKP